jgi:hypothetical protein
MKKLITVLAVLGMVFALAPAVEAAEVFSEDFSSAVTPQTDGFLGLNTLGDYAYSATLDWTPDVSYGSQFVLTVGTSFYSAQWAAHDSDSASGVAAVAQQDSGVRAMAIPYAFAGTSATVSFDYALHDDDDALPLYVYAVMDVSGTDVSYLSGNVNDGTSSASTAGAGASTSVVSTWASASVSLSDSIWKTVESNGLAIDNLFAEWNDGGTIKTVTAAHQVNNTDPTGAAGALSGTVKEVGIIMFRKSNSRPIWVDNVSVVSVALTPTGTLMLVK